MSNIVRWAEKRRPMTVAFSFMCKNANQVNAFNKKVVKVISSGIYFGNNVTDIPCDDSSKVGMFKVGALEGSKYPIVVVHFKDAMHKIPASMTSKIMEESYKAQYKRPYNQKNAGMGGCMTLPTILLMRPILQGHVKDGMDFPCVHNHFLRVVPCMRIFVKDAVLYTKYDCKERSNFGISEKELRKMRQSACRLAYRRNMAAGVQQQAAKI